MTRRPSDPSEPPGTPPQRRHTGARLRLFAAWCVLGFTAALLVTASGGEFRKVQFMTVLSGSMVPTLEVGDLVVAEVVSPRELRTGDLTTFRDPSTHKLVTHRVQSVLWRGELADVITRGDANEIGEGWSIGAEGSVGRVVLRVPRVGFAVGALGTTAGQLGMAAVALALGVWALVLIWRPAPARPVPSQPVVPTVRAARSPRHAAGRRVPAAG